MRGRERNSSPPFDRINRFAGFAVRTPGGLRQREENRASARDLALNRNAQIANLGAYRSAGLNTNRREWPGKKA